MDKEYNLTELGIVDCKAVKVHEGYMYVEGIDSNVPPPM